MKISTIFQAFVRRVDYFQLTLYKFLFLIICLPCRQMVRKAELTGEAPLSRNRSLIGIESSKINKLLKSYCLAICNQLQSPYLPQEIN